MKTVLLTNGRVIDPGQHIDRVIDLWVRDGHVVGLGPQQGLHADDTIDCRDKVVCPGLIDMHVHLREPGREEDETIASGTAAALAGGVTSVACMPNTEPAIDSVETLQFIQLRARAARQANVFPIAAITLARKGKELVEFPRLAEHGAVAFTDDGAPVMDAAVMHAAMQAVGALDGLIMDHNEDLGLTAGGLVNEGEISRKLGVKGLPGVAEDVLVARDILLADACGCRYHALHTSTAGGVELVRWGKQRGIPVTTEVCPHHFTLTDESLLTLDSNFKMSPPLRAQRDVDAILEGLRDGTIDVICTDHAPHATAKKARPFAQAPNGIIGLETLVPLCIKALIEPGVLTWPELIAKLTLNPARILKLDRGTLKPGALADITIIDPTVEWTVDVSQCRSKSRNSPYHGWRVRGRAVATLVGGTIKGDIHLY
jgi:dihydroorotase